jgi:hypothetical protein
VQCRADRADSDAGRIVIAQALQEFYLSHRQGFPRIVGADACAQDPAKAVDDVGQCLGIARS